MLEAIFDSQYAQRNELVLQIAEAVKSWRMSALNYEKVLSQWHLETDLQEKQRLWEQLRLCEKIRDGDLAQVQLLADRYISD